jgi:hypothetical protein
MITKTQLIAIFGTQLASGIGVTIIRVNQKVKKLPRVFGTYNVPFEDVESLHQSEVTVADAGSRNADVSTWEAARASVTLKFYGDKGSDYWLVRQAANDAINWFRENRVSGVSMRVISPQIRDETEFIEQNYQYVMSFDVRIDTCEEHVQAVEALERIEATPTENGSALPVIIINEP